MAEKIRAERNRTLTVSESEIPGLERFILSANDIKKEFVDDCVINADIFDCLDSIPDGYFNLIIIDPPYNLDKDFHGKKFSSMKSDAYEDYLRSWFYKVCDKLATNGTTQISDIKKENGILTTTLNNSNKEITWMKNAYDELVIDI